ncbi:MAG: hypothetical protein ACRD3L_12960 [Terriglobales bacterium]
MSNPGEKANASRTLIWVNDATFQGWVCSRCEWNSPLPTLLSDPTAKTAYDRLATGKFRQHACESYQTRLPSTEISGFSTRLRKLVEQGFKPKDAVEILVQEVSFETRGDEKALNRARADGEDFLRRLREGLH